MGSRPGGGLAGGVGACGCSTETLLVRGPDQLRVSFADSVHVAKGYAAGSPLVGSWTGTGEARCRTLRHMDLTDLPDHQVT